MSHSPDIASQRSEQDEKPLPSPQPVVEYPVPDGGSRAWLVVIGELCLSFSTLGYIMAWGSFQAYYETVALKTSTPSAIAWIGSVQYSLLFLPGLLAGRVFDLGYFRLQLVSSTLLYIIASFLIAECKTYWQVFLCQGLAFGLAGGWLFIPCMALVSHWFKEKRPLAIGIISLGSGVGGVVFPILFRSLLPKIGFQWTVRTFAFINLAMFIVANLTMKTRLPPKSGTVTVDFRSFVTPAYIAYTLGTMVAFLGLYTLLTFVTLSAEVIGIRNSLAFYLVAVINGTSAVGRVAAGLLAMRFGPINVMIISTAIAGVLTFLWPYVTTEGAFIAIVAIYGFASAPFVALFPVVVAQLGAAHDAGLRGGTQMTIMALGALAGPPIAGAIVGHHGFKQAGIYAGTTVIISAGLMALSKVLLLKRLFTGKQ